MSHNEEINEQSFSNPYPSQYQLLLLLMMMMMMMMMMMTIIIMMMMGRGRIQLVKCHIMNRITILRQSIKDVDNIIAPSTRCAFRSSD